MPSARPLDDAEVAAVGAPGTRCVTSRPPTSTFDRCALARRRRPARARRRRRSGRRGWKGTLIERDWPAPAEPARVQCREDGDEQAPGAHRSLNERSGAGGYGLARDVLGRAERLRARPAPRRGSSRAPRARKRSVTAVPFSVCDDLGALLVLRPVADPEAARLVVGRVRGRGHLAVALLVREPRLDVVLLDRRGAEVAGGDVDDAVGEPERADDLLLDREQPVVLLARALRARRRRRARPC